MPERHPGNAAGNWYVDRNCIDCSAARTVAPDLIVSPSGQSVFARDTGRAGDGLAGTAPLLYGLGEDREPQQPAGRDLPAENDRRSLSARL